MGWGEEEGSVDGEREVGRAKASSGGMGASAVGQAVGGAVRGWVEPEKGSGRGWEVGVA